MTARADEVSQTLPELVQALVAPLFARFSFFEASDELYTTEIRRMRTGT